MPPGSCSRARSSSGSALVPDRGDLIEARDALRAVEPPAGSPRRAVRADGRLRSVAVPHRALRRGRRAVRYGARVRGGAPAVSRDRLLDWWASALDRHVQEAGGDAAELYGRVLERMEQEARRDPSSAAAAYWIAAAARGLGQLERAWQAAMAAWVRTGLTDGSRRGAAGGSRSPGAHGDHPRSRARDGPCPGRPAGGRRHDGHRLGALQGRLGALTARTVVAATMSAPPASAHAPGSLAVDQPRPHRVQHRLGEQQQRRFERGHIAHALRQAQIRQPDLKHAEPRQRHPVGRKRPR